MAEYRPIKNKIWTDTWFNALQTDQKLLWVFLLTNEYVQISGVYELPMNLIAPLTGIENWQAIFQKFIDDGKIETIDGWIFIKNYLKNQTNQINKRDNIFKSIIAYLNENPKVIGLFNLTEIDPYKTLLSPLGKERKEERIKERKEEREETPTSLFEKWKQNLLWSEILREFPDRNYTLQFKMMCDWWLNNKKSLPKNISAFSNWLSKTKEDESIRIRRINLSNDETQKRKIQEAFNTPQAKPETLKKLQEYKNKLLKKG